MVLLIIIPMKNGYFIGFADHYPYEMAISLGIYPIFRQTHRLLQSKANNWPTVDGRNPAPPWMVETL